MTYREALLAVADELLAPLMRTCQSRSAGRTWPLCAAR